jgi:GcrA cell cycle regulator
MSFQWTGDLIGEVATYLKQGLSAAQIGAQLGISRNAVIGKVGREQALSRIGFAWKRAQPFAGKHPDRLKAIRANQPKLKSDKPKRIRMAYNTTPPEPEHTVAKPMLLLGAHDCRWPINDADRDEQHLFCAGITESGKSFCAHHLHRAFDHRRTSHV